MTDEELEAIEARLSKANEAKRRTENLTKALELLHSGQVAALEILRTNDSDPLNYKGPENQQYRRVCWANQYPGMVDAIWGAIVMVVENYHQIELKKFQEL